MTGEIIQANYEQLQSITHCFTQQAEVIRQVHTALARALDPLRCSDWKGRGAEAFFAEMNTDALPAADRLQAALAEASRVAQEVIRIMQQAEEEAARPFQSASEGTSDGSGVIGQPMGGPAGGPVSTPDGMASAAGYQKSTPKKDPGEIFNETYMGRFIGSHFKGENSAELNRLMESLVSAGATNNAQVNRILNRIADIRGVNRAAFQAQYQTYLQLRENGRATGGNYPGIDLSRHGEFLGSTVSLRFGAVVGDVFGLDPVFGSLLQPTGGLVGPGSHSYQPGQNDAIGYHGIFHDAAGYLYNYQEIGPGYDYLDREPFSTGSPLTGQIAGISWWMAHPQLDAHIPVNNLPDIPYVPEFLEPGLGKLADDMVPAVRVISAAAEGSGNIVDGIGDVFAGDIVEGVGDMGAGLGTIATGIGRAMLDYFD